MTTRKLTHAQEIALLKNQIETTKKFMDSAIIKAEALCAVAKTKPLTEEQHKRVQGLIDYIHEENVFLENAQKTIRSFYAPVSA